ncbi:MAG: lipopolysaccharide kinase InaA family protein [Campylobacterota bacterium]|nr:lipopolysaccharide kinase InaA family protein [Campylobacterota bacterium]
MIYKTVNEKFDNFLINIKKYFCKDTNVILFKKRNTIKIIEFTNTKYVVKSFKIPHLLNKIVYKFFRESKAKRSYENSVKLLELGINTPKPIGYSEFSSLFFFKESFYVSEFFDYDFEIRALFKDKNFSDRENILKEFTKFSVNLHNKGVYHIDYSPGNILIKKVNGIYIFNIIDVNRMKFLDFDIDLRMKSMSKLTSNIDDNKLILKYYAEISNIDLSILEKKLEFHLKAQAKYLKNKKQFKKIKG